MKRIATFIAIILCFAAIQTVKAWNTIGHASIASLAEQHLTETTKEKCRSYLKHTLPYHAVWMDLWRNCKGFEETSYWHGYPVDENNKRFKGETRDAAYQINRICKKMRKYEKLKDSIVCDNLKYLIHLVGDMHCPSHVKYNEEPNLKQRSVKKNGTKLGFHSFWDGSIGYYNKGMKCDEIAAKYDTLTEAEIAQICEGNPNDWALANAEQMREIYTLLPMHSEVTTLPEQNHERMNQIVVQQALRGGYRLAKILNEIFSK